MMEATNPGRTRVILCLVKGEVDVSRLISQLTVKLTDKSEDQRE